MMTEASVRVQGSRSIEVTEADGETVIVITPSRPVAVLLFLAAFVAGLAFFGINAYGRFQPSDLFGQQTFLVFWLCCWLLGLSVMALLVFWMAFGTEVVTVRRGVLNLSKRLLFLSYSRKYSSVFISNLRWEVVPIRKDRRMSQIAFAYGGKTINFANWSGQDEGRSIIYILTERLALNRTENAQGQSEAA